MLRVYYEPDADPETDMNWVERWDADVRGGLQPPPPEYYENKLSPRSDRKYYARFVETVKVFLEHGADPNVRDTDSHSTPLHGAATTGDAEIAVHLIEAGAQMQ